MVSVGEKKRVGRERGGGAGAKKRIDDGGLEAAPDHLGGYQIHQQQ